MNALGEHPSTQQPWKKKIPGGTIMPHRASPAQAENSVIDLTVGRRGESDYCFGFCTMARRPRVGMSR